MGETEPRRESVGRGELFFLSHPGTENTFSGYGLTVESGKQDLLVGLLMIDRPRPANPEWLSAVERTFGALQLIPMTTRGERGIVCRMQVETPSLAHLRQFPSEKAVAIKTALEPLLATLPNPVFSLRWNEESRLWESQMVRRWGMISR